MKELGFRSLLCFCFLVLAVPALSSPVLMEKTGVENSLLDGTPRFKRGFHKMESQISRETFVRREKSLGSVVHEVVIAIQQKNLPELKQMVYDRATKGHSLFQKWFTFQEIGDIVKNEEGYVVVKEWLAASGATVTWSSPHKEYIKASAPIATWEEMLSTKFYQFEDLTRPDKASSEGKGRILHRALDYSIPAELKESISVIFHTVQTPPRFRPKYQHRIAKDIEKTGASRLPDRYESSSYKSHLRFVDPKTVLKQDTLNHEDGKRPFLQQTGDDVTISWLNSFYKVGSNLGSPFLNQSIFETDDESFSQNDLRDFQDEYGLTVQEARVIGGHESDHCTATACGEGNLDIQYIMGMAQRTASIYWYVPVDGDPFITWILDVAADPYPPQSNSISWGEIEQLAGRNTISQWETEAMKLAGRGVTITVSSGDDGAPNEYGTTCLCKSKVPSPFCDFPYIFIFNSFLLFNHFSFLSFLL
jgi:tripeptidyl-peptidase-1